MQPAHTALVLWLSTMGGDGGGAGGGGEDQCGLKLLLFCVDRGDG